MNIFTVKGFYYEALKEKENYKGKAYIDFRSNFQDPLYTLCW